VDSSFVVRVLWSKICGQRFVVRPGLVLFRKPNGVASCCPCENRYGLKPRRIKVRPLDKAAFLEYQSRLTTKLSPSNMLSSVGRTRAGQTGEQGRDRRDVHLPVTIARPAFVPPGLPFEKYLVSRGQIGDRGHRISSPNLGSPFYSGARYLRHIRNPHPGLGHRRSPHRITTKSPHSNPPPKDTAAPGQTHTSHPLDSA
jgi:hypothetical protein